MNDSLSTEVRSLTSFQSREPFTHEPGMARIGLALWRNVRFGSWHNAVVDLVQHMH